MTHNDNMIRSYLTFKLGKEEFASNVNQVLNILEMTKITEIPQAPVYMKGVINLRGKVLPIIDTRVKFGMTPTEITDKTCIVVLDLLLTNNEVIHIGIFVDEVISVIEVSDSDIKPPPDLGTSFKSEFIYGMAEKNDSLIMFLDMIKAFSMKEITVLSEHHQPELEV